MIIDKPWKHEIIDNFLEQEDFDFLSTVDILTPEDGGYELSKNQIFKDGQLNSSYPYDFLKRFEKRYFQKCIDILERHAPDKVDDVTYMELNVVVTGKTFEFPVHPDSQDKLLSCVIYLQPEENIGTIMYEAEDGDPVATCEWKQNRCMIFSRDEETWHSYKSDGKSERRTLVLNLRGQYGE